MKKFMFSKINIFFLFALLAFAACEDDSNPFGGIGDDDDDTTVECGDVSGSVKDFYEDDATRLAIGLINAEGSITSESVLIPPALIERMSDVLTAVHASEFAARDSVVDVYDVHIFPEYTLNEVVVEVSTDTTGNDWIQNWLDGNRFTGNTDADAIVSTYDLSISNVLLLGDNAVIIFNSDSPLNIPALVDDFAGISGVEDAGTNKQAGDGDDIVVTPLGNDEDGYKVVYEVTYDDCENTCLKSRFYEFNVTDNCNVTYINTYGDDPPELEDRE